MRRRRVHVHGLRASKHVHGQCRFEQWQRRFPFRQRRLGPPADRNVAYGNSVHGFGLYAVSDIISSHDEATANGGFGFSLFQTASSAFTHDVSQDNEHGFVAARSNGNGFSHDVANHNRGYGFLVYDGSSGNTVEQSVAHGNLYADAADFTNAGANAWMSNSFGTTLLP